MGYRIFLRVSIFTIKPANIAPALAALREAHPTATADATDLDDARDCLGWAIGFSNSGGVDTIDLNGDKYHAHEEPLIAIAPFVESGSYIEMQGEEGELWRWEFRDGCLYEMDAEVEWRQSAVLAGEPIA